MRDIFWIKMYKYTYLHFDLFSVCIIQCHLEKNKEIQRIMRYKEFQINAPWD